MPTDNNAKTILLVEDEALIAMNEANALEKHGFQVITVYNARKAIETLSAKTVDLILMDVDLGQGKMDGIEAAEIILRTYDIPIVFLSSHTEPEIVEKTERVTSYGYVVKTSGEAVLIASINMAFRLKEAHTGQIEKSKQLDTLLDNAEDLIGRLDRKGTHLYVNQALCDAMGIPYEEYVGKTIDELGAPPELAATWNEAVGQVFDTGETALIEFELPAPNDSAGLHENRVLECKIVPEIVIKGEVNTVVAISRDITDRIRTEQALRESEEKFRALLELSPAGIYRTDTSGNCVYANPKWLEMAGMTMDEAKGRGWVNGLHPDDRETVGKNWYRSVQSGGKWGYEYRFQTPAGKTTWVYGIAQKIYNTDGEITGYIGTNFDITKRKMMEEDLRRSEALLTEAQKIADIGSFMWDLRTDKLEWSQNMYTIAGLDPESFCGNLQETIDSMIHSEDRDSVFKQIEAMVKQKKTWPMEFRLMRPDGNVRRLRSGSRFIYDENGIPIVNIGIHQDVTDQKKAFDDLREREEKYNAIVQTTMDGFWQVDKNGTIVDVNETSCRMSGYSREELLGMTVGQIEARESAEEVTEHMKRLAREGNSRFESVHRRKDGVLFPVEISSTYFAAGDGMFLSFIRDITERKEADKALRESETQKQIILNSSVEMIAYYNTDLEILWANRASAESVGKTSEELVGRHCYNVWHGRNEPCEGCPVLKARDEKTPREGEQKSPDGRYWYLRGYPILNDEQDVVALVEFGQDITERKEWEKQLQRSLEEKDFLMKELNHRVKNNLTIISSLINLKNSALGGEMDLSDIRNQIDAIRIVHEKLHTTETITHIDFGDYIGDVLQTIFHTLADARVDVQNSITDCSMLTKSSIALGLIINELATNAIKHGFVPGNQARFTIGLTENEADNEYMVTCSNNGRPFPDDIDVHNPGTLGLQLISALIQQLDGSIELIKRPHPVFTIRFPMEHADQ